MRTSSGVARMRIEVIIELTKLDLPGAGGAGDEQVRHLGEVGDDVAALDVLADAHDHRVLVAAGGLAAQHVAEADLLAVGVGDLDADRGLAGDRG